MTTARLSQLILTTSPSITSVTAPGSTISYSLTVTNGGTVAITDLAVHDRSTGATASTPSVDCPTTSLVAGATTSCTATYRVSAADLDAGAITNTATVTGLDIAGAPVTSAAASATVTAVQAPALTLTQSTTPSMAAAVGQQLAFGFAVTNPGNVTIGAIAVSAAIAAPGGPSPVVHCPATSLARGPG